jgi:hypothetical protein
VLTTPYSVTSEGGRIRFGVGVVLFLIVARCLSSDDVFFLGVYDVDYERADREKAMAEEEVRSRYLYRQHVDRDLCDFFSVTENAYVFIFVISMDEQMDSCRQVPWTTSMTIWTCSIKWRGNQRRKKKMGFASKFAVSVSVRSG